MALKQEEAKVKSKELIDQIFTLISQEGTEKEVKILKAELLTVLEKFD